jgi:hypothetical protein
MFSLKFVLIAATIIMMSVKTNETTAPTNSTTTAPTTATTYTIDDMSILNSTNECGSSSLGSNKPKSASECLVASTNPDLPDENRCCYASVSLNSTMSSSFCMKVHNLVTDDTAKELFKATNLTLNDFRCDSAFVQFSILLIALMTLLL